MRFDFDLEKSKRLKANPERGIDFEEVQALFDAEHIIDRRSDDPTIRRSDDPTIRRSDDPTIRRSDDPEQFRAIGWVSGTLFSVVYEVRQDAKGEFCHLVTLWKATKEERKAYAENVY